MLNVIINRALSTLVFLVTLSACGFHLAGTMGNLSDDLNNISVQGMSDGLMLAGLVERHLTSNRVNVVAANQATMLINVVDEETSKVVLSVDSDGKAREYELIFKASFEVKKPDGSNLLPDKQYINLRRDFVFDKNNILASNEEEQELFDEMRDEAAKFIIYRLQTIQPPD